MTDDVARLPTRGQTERRRADMERAIASARIEGGDISHEARAIMELYCTGAIDAGEMVARIRRRHAAPDRNSATKSLKS